MEGIKIESIEQLRLFAGTYDGLNCYVLLNYGLHSSKSIHYENGVYWIWNLIDDTEQELTEEQLFDRSLTIIGDAMKSGNLFQD